RYRTNAETVAKLPRTHSQIVCESPRILAPIGRMEFLWGIAIAKQCRLACLPECKTPKAGKKAGGGAAAGRGRGVPARPPRRGAGAVPANSSGPAQSFLRSQPARNFAG